MPIKPSIFEFTSYSANLAIRELSFSYQITFENREPLTFTEQLVLPKGIDKNIPPKLLDNILQGLHLIIGISYYKLYIPGKFKLPYKLSKKQAEFWNTVYRKGLGEFLYRNNLDPEKLANFLDCHGVPRNDNDKTTAIQYPRQDRVLSAIGGGKDSIVSTELLKAGKFKVTTLYAQTQKPNEQIKTLLKTFNLPSLTIERYLDEKIFLKHQDSYNGHIPVSAIFAFIGTLVGILYDYRYVVVANERSSNFGNIEYHGEIVNHQWSKSAEFEEIFQEYTRRYITPDVIYFSLLRHSNEIRIAKLFAQYPKYFKLFSSCNRVAVIARKAKQSRWCGRCPKCAFAFAILSPFIPKKKLIKIFGKDLFADESLKQTFADISGKGTMKPFDCVGTFEEVTVALSLAHGHPERSEGSNVLQTYPAPLIPAQFAFLGMQKALILGYGKEGKVTKAYLKKHYPKLKIGIADQSREKNYLQKQFAYDIAIKTPGIPKELVKIFYTTATNIFLNSVDPAQVIGVTGSKGKSTTASLIYAILKQAKRPAMLLGNIGKPMLSALSLRGTPKQSSAVFVLEFSSYMLDDIQISPHIAVVTSLFPEHMDHHGSIEKYYAAKANIWKFQRREDYLVIDVKSYGDPRRQWVLNAINKVVGPHLELQTYKNNTSLLGFHNFENIKLAETVAHILEIPDDTIAKAIKNFKSLPHRLQNIGTYQGITFYDDANAAAPEATIEAIKALPKIQTIFLGGQDRGYDFSALERIIHASQIKNIVLFPDSGSKMLKKTDGLNILKTKSMKEAVAFAYKHTEAGKICLLSMASPSYSLWKNFEEKGKEFQKYVKLTGRKK